MALTRITKGVIKPNENYDTHNINSTGIITATGANISGNMSVGGVLTYEDVTNIDSVGIITARAGVRVNADGSTSSNYMSVGASDDLKIYHDSKCLCGSKCNNNCCDRYNSCKHIRDRMYCWCWYNSTFSR